MNIPTKVRPDAVLVNQSAEFQAAIYEMTLPDPGNRSYDKILTHLAAEHGIRLGRSPLRRWRDRYELRLRQEAAEESVRLALEARCGLHPEETAEELFAFGQMILAVEAVKNSEVRAWSAIQKLRQATVYQSMAERRQVLLERKAAREEETEATVAQVSAKVTKVTEKSEREGVSSLALLVGPSPAPASLCPPMPASAAKKIK